MRRTRRPRGRLPAIAAAASELVEAVLTGDAVSTVEERRAAFDGEVGATPVARYVETVRRHAHRVTDEDIGELRAAGLSDDVIFELTVAAALGAASERLQVVALISDGPA
jgi:alkylhydroperoxidase family enzyme